ncbi:MAG: polysaccharide biosynthesis tyrosine autokinase [Actinomycetota bacterium]|nr:polysaccharide biosynthesis tyrosine autokinase [Actinomycetota bacterium]
MELRDYLRILWNRRWLIALCVAVAAGSALGFSSRMTPKYEAVAKIFVGPRAIEKDDASSAMQELTFSQQYVTSYAEILKSRPLAQQVVEKLQAPISASELVERTETKILPETRLIEVTVTDPSPGRAQLYVNELVNSFVRDENNQFGGGGGISASVLEQAVRPTTPVSPNPMRNGVIGGFLGLMLGVAVAFLSEQLDTTLRTKEDVERVLAPLPVIATIPLTPLSEEWSLFMETFPNSPQSEAIRILRTNIQFFSVDRPIRRVLVTSPFAGDGKTTVSTNLAVAMAAIGSTVILVETDLRKPVLDQYFEDAAIGPGLSDVLSGQAELSDAIKKSRIPNLSVVIAGPTPPNPSELLGSERMAKLLDSLSEMADFVILDTPPTLPVTDASLLAPHTDGVILVVRAGQTPSGKALDATRNFERLGVRVLGIAVNALERDPDGSYYYHYRNFREPAGEGEGRKKGKGSREPDADEWDEFVISNTRPATRPPTQEPEEEARDQQDTASKERERSPVLAPRPSNGSSNMIKARAMEPEDSHERPEASTNGTGLGKADFRARLRSSLGNLDYRDEDKSDNGSS